MPETPFTEANALLTILNEREDEAREILDDCSKVELMRLARAAQWLSNVCWDMGQDGRN